MLLQEHDVRHIIIKHVFSDDELDELRAAWGVTLPHSGATELDECLRSNYTKVRTVGRYEIHVRQDQLSGLLPPISRVDWSPGE